MFKLWDSGSLQTLFYLAFHDIAPTTEGKEDAILFLPGGDRNPESLLCLTHKKEDSLLLLVGVLVLDTHMGCTDTTVVGASLTLGDSD